MTQGHASPAISAAHRLTGMYRHTVTVDGHRLNVFAAGTGPETILLVPGIPDSSAVYRGQIPGLLEAGYRVIAPDLLGQGDSDMPAEVASYTIAKDQERLWAIADELGARTFTLWVTTAGRHRHGLWPPTIPNGSSRTSR